MLFEELRFGGKAAAANGTGSRAGTLPTMVATTTPAQDGFESFAYTAAEHCASRHAATAILLADFGTEIRVVEVDDGDAGHVLIEKVIGSTPLRLALASRVNWSPLSRGPLSLAWALVVVEPFRPAWLLVRRVCDRIWTRIPLNAAPWFALSTAAGLRAALGGKPLEIRSATSARLFASPRDVPNPPVDDKGLL